MKKKDTKAAKQPTFERPVEGYFHQLAQTFTQDNKAGYALFLILLFFGVMGMIWMIPFPQFDFLVRLNMHTFLNWGSFFIAIIVYLYLRLAPTLSYAILFSIGVMSYFIVQMEYWERDGGPAVWLISLIAAIVGLVGIIGLSRTEKKTIYGQDLWFLIRIGPIWLWSKVFDKFKIKY